jgi:hypothetical protein
MEITANWAGKTISDSGQSMAVIRVPLEGLNEINPLDHSELANFGLASTPQGPGGAPLWSRAVIHWDSNELTVETESLDQGAEIRRAIDSQLPSFAGLADTLQKGRDREAEELTEQARRRDIAIQKFKDDIGN